VRADRKRTGQAREPARLEDGVALRDRKVPSKGGDHALLNKHVQHAVRVGVDDPRVADQQG